MYLFNLYYLTKTNSGPHRSFARGPAFKIIAHPCSRCSSKWTMPFLKLIWSYTNIDVCIFSVRTLLIAFNYVRKMYLILSALQFRILQFQNDREQQIDHEFVRKTTPPKNLRFFGDTDIESNDDSMRQKPSRSRSGLTSHHDGLRSQSTRDLQNISEEPHSPEVYRRRSNHASMVNISENDKENFRLSGKPPISPNHARNGRDVSRLKEEHSRRKKNEVSSVESSTEGDSSQQSQRSVVYLHAATGRILNTTSTVFE